MRATIRLKLSAAFGIVVVLAAVMTTLGIVNLWSLNGAITRMLQGPIARNDVAGDLNVELLLLQRAEHNLIMTRVPAEIRTYDNEVLTRRLNVLRLRDRLDGLGTADTHRRLKLFDEAWREWMPVEEQIRRLSYVNTIASNAHAAVMEMSQGQPIFDRVQANLDAINVAADADLRRVADETRRQYETARDVLVSASLAVLAVSIGAATWISLTINRGLAKVRVLAEAVAVGDLDQSVQVSGDDEIKDLVGTVNVMTDNLRATARLADQIAGGDLTAQPRSLSSRDMLGAALQRMVVRLRTARDIQAELTRVSRVAALGEFAASIAHEVNQPLAAIVTNSDASLRWLDHTPPNLDQARQAIKRTIRDATRASDVIRRTRALTVKEEPKVDDLDLNDAIREVLAFTQTELKRSKVVVQADLAEQTPLVRGDRIQFQQVMINLIMNGVDSMRSISGQARVLKIRTGTVPSGEVSCEVEDCGMGLDPEVAEKLFDHFFTTKSGGTGLGLAISRSIIESHGGRIWASSASPRGAVFSFTVPRSAAQA